MKTTRILLGYCIVIASWVLMGCNVTDSSPDPPIVPQASESVTDVEGNVYRTAKISNQTWMTENLNVGRFKNGDPIPEAKNKEEWLQAGSACKPAWCYYNNDSATGKRYGKLYNWYAVADPRGLAPAGWSVPNNNEWGALISALGGSQQAGTKMKSTTGWNGNNASGFDGLPGGGRAYTGAFGDIGAAGIWWSSLEMTTLNAWGYNLNHTDGNILQGSFYKTTGLSVRALKSTSSPDDSTSGKTLGEQLQAVLDASLKSSRGRGVSLAVIMPDGELWAGVGGISHGTTPITRDMRFSAGSIEKMFAAATILQLAEEGRLTLDDSLYQWLPAYPYVDSTITIRQLLNHTSGLYNFVDNREFWDALFREPTKI